MFFMKYSRMNIITSGFSGKLGDIVYYQRGGKTFVRQAPGSYNKVATEKQTPGRNRFTEAVAFAKKIVADPVQKAIYQLKARKGRSAYSQAIVEYMAQPDS